MKWISRRVICFRGRSELMSTAHRAVLLGLAVVGLFLFTANRESQTTEVDINTLPQLNNLTVQFLTNNADVCDSPDIKVIIFVLSRPHRSTTRNLVRNSYGDRRAFPHARVVFAVGQSNDSEVNRRVLAENEVHGDLVVGDYMDTYYNCTIKVYSALYWVDHYCSQAPYTVKTDEDVTVNMFNLMEYFNTRPIVTSKNVPENVVMSENGSNVNGSVQCHINDYPIVVREPSNTWYMAEEDYPGEWYPLGCGGGAWLLDTVLTTLMWRGGPDVRFVKFEDVFFPAIVRMKYNATITDIPNMIGDVIDSKSLFWIDDGTKTDKRLRDMWMRLFIKEVFVNLEL